MIGHYKTKLWQEKDKNGDEKDLHIPEMYIVLIVHLMKITMIKWQLWQDKINICPQNVGRKGKAGVISNPPGLSKNTSKAILYS